MSFSLQALVSVGQQEIDIVFGKKDFLSVSSVVEEHALTPTCEEVFMLLFDFVILCKRKTYFCDLSFPPLPLSQLKNL